MHGYDGRLNVSTQIELLPEDVCAGFHGDNPESRAAFDALLPDLGHLQERVLNFMDQEFEKGTRVTVKTVRWVLNMEHQTASARLTELKKMELVEPTKARHEGCAVLRITELGRRTLQAWQRKN